ncbi:MAG: carboxypeptidase-like regulatory domain-containing protein [Terracidiphilus sp.]|nr:carboxypeptidase-like regulatory domain-containing protein [Terracidiphilus sp.]
MIRKNALYLFWGGLLLMVLSSGGWAQSGAGKIQGTVYDPAGAVVTGANVLITQQATGITQKTVSNGNGFYIVTALFTGQYTVQVSAPGMREWQRGVTLQVNQTAVIDATLQMASAEQKITVEADVTPLITIDSPSVGATLERQRIDQLPENGRSIVTLVQNTTPGMEGEIVNGLTYAALEWTQDGASLESRDAADPPTAPPDPDTIQEVHVETSNASAKYDRPSTVVLSTKSGTNEFHGSAFETNRDNGYGVARNRQDTFTKAPKLVRNEYGVSFGGPVYLPYFSRGAKLYNGKNRAFFFFSYADLALRQQVSTRAYVPTANMRQGIFTNLTNASGQAITLYDNQTTTNAAPWTRQAFANNVIPSLRISPLAKSLFAVTPAATTGDNPLVTTNYVGGQPTTQDKPAITFRIDQHINDKDSIYERFSHSNLDLIQTGYNSSPQSLDNTWNHLKYEDHTDGLVTGWNHVFSPNFVNEFLATMNYRYDVWQTGDNAPHQQLTTQLGLPNPFNVMGVPVIQGTSTGSGAASTFMSYGLATVYRKAEMYNNLFDDNATFIHKRHDLQFGFRYRHERFWLLDNQQAPATVQFGGMGTALYNPAGGTAISAYSNTGMAIGDLYLGDATTYYNPKFGGWLRMRDQEITGYIVDDYKAKHNLTVNIGLRYTAHPATTERDNQFTGIDFTNHAVVIGSPLTQLYAKGLVNSTVVAAVQSLGAIFETPAQAGYPDRMMNGQDAIYSPRLGIAYPFGRSHSGGSWRLRCLSLPDTGTRLLRIDERANAVLLQLQRQLCQFRHLA